MTVDLWGTGVRVLVVYPGIVDTELFSNLDNDPLDVPVEPITVDDCVGMILDALDRDALEVQGEAMVQLGAIPRAKENLAKLTKLCGTTCPQVAQLNTAIARGPAMAVATPAATTPPTPPKKQH